MDFCSYFIKTKKNQEIVNSEISSKTPLLQTSKKLTKSPLLQTSKNREIAEKKIVRNFLDKIKILFFFEFFSENVLKTLLRGRETTRKKYRIVFEKFTFFEKISKKSLKKKSCSKFFDKFKNFHFLRVFLRKCLKNSSKGTRNN